MLSGRWGEGGLCANKIKLVAVMRTDECKLPKIIVLADVRNRIYSPQIMKVRFVLM